MAEKVSWIGKSGTRYEYGVYGRDTNWKDVAGNYIFAKKSRDGRFRALYIGETSSLKDRVTPSHEKWDDALNRYELHCGSDWALQRPTQSSLRSYDQPPS